MTDVVTSKDRPKYLRLEEQGEQTSHRPPPPDTGGTDDGDDSGQGTFG